MLILSSKNPPPPQKKGANSQRNGKIIKYLYNLYNLSENLSELRITYQTKEKNEVKRCCLTIHTLLF